MSVSPEEIIAIIWFFTTFNAIFLAIRLYLVTTRPRITSAALASETCLFLAFSLFLIATGSTTTYQAMLIKYRDDPAVKRVLGMPRDKLILLFKFQLAEVEMYITGIWLVKGSFLSLYFDIFRSLPTGIKRILQLTTIYTLLSWFANILLPLIYCRPLRLVWAIEGHCTSFRSTLGTTFPMVTNVTTDMLIMIIPILVLRRLNLQKPEILAISFLLLLGCLTMMATMFRYVYVMKRNALGKSGSPNLITQAQIWSYAEGCTAVFVACLPAGRVFLAQHKRGSASTDSSRQAHSNFSSKLSQPSQGLRLPDRYRGESEEHGLVVFKTTTFGVESTAQLGGGEGEDCEGLVIGHAVINGPAGVRDP